MTTTPTTTPDTPEPHGWLCHPEDNQAPPGGPNGAPGPENCWHCDTLTETGHDCETCRDAGEITGLVYHCPTCGRWWGYVSVTQIPLGGGA